MPRTISPRAKAYVRRAAEAQFTCTVRIFATTVPTLNTTTGLYTSSEGAEVYSGPARIWSVDGGQVIAVGEGDYAYQSTFCSIPWDTVPVPDVDQQIEVLTSDDTDLVGRTFRIMSVDGGGQARATRRMQITGMTENRSWQG
jgi:Family of unknown function (DUF6093)